MRNEYVLRFENSNRCIVLENEPVLLDVFKEMSNRIVEIVEAYKFTPITATSLNQISERISMILEKFNDGIFYRYGFSAYIESDYSNSDNSMVSGFIKYRDMSEEKDDRYLVQEPC